MSARTRLPGSLAASDLSQANLGRWLEALGFKVRLDDEKGKAEKPETGMVESTALAAAGATKAEAPKYTQINISVSKMQASENIYIESGVKQSENQIANKVLEMLTGALNDSQRMAGVH